MTTKQRITFIGLVAVGLWIATAVGVHLAIGLYG